MKLRRFLMEDWLASCKDTSAFNLGESGMPDLTVEELLVLCGKPVDSLTGILLRDHDTSGTFRLRKVIAETYSESWITPEHITVTTGTSEALFILFNLLLEDRPGVIAPFPAFQALTEVPLSLGADMRYYNLTEQNGFLPDPDEICSLIDDNVGIVVINTPHNPSGILFPTDSAERIISRAARHGALILSDEHYRYLPLDSPSPLLSLALEDGSVIATGSITKCFGMIGLRMGWIVAPPDLIHRIRDFRDYLTHTLSPVSDFLASIALEHAETFIGSARRVIIRNRSLLEDMTTSTPGISLVRPEAGIVCFPSFDLPLSSDDFARGLLDEHGVFVLPGSAFNAEHHIRITLGQHPDYFSQAINLIATYITELKGHL